MEGKIGYVPVKNEALEGPGIISRGDFAKSNRTSHHADQTMATEARI